MSKIIMNKIKSLKRLLQVLFLSIVPFSAAAADEALPRFYGQWPSVLPPLLAIGFALGAVLFIHRMSKMIEVTGLPALVQEHISDRAHDDAVSPRAAVGERLRRRG